MKKIKLLIGVACSLFFLTSCVTSEASDSQNNQTKDNSLQRVLDNNELIVATSGTMYPASYYNEENELVGYDVDIAKEVAKKLGVDITFKEYNVDGQITSVAKGESDFAANDFGITKEKDKKFSLSTPIKYSFDSMIVRKDGSSGINSLEDLDGKKAAGEPNTSYMRLAESYGADLVTYDNATNDQYLTDVANGRTDVIINDYYLQKMSVAALPDVPVKVLNNVFFNNTTSGFLFKEGNNSLKNKVNEIIKDLRDSGKLKEISKTYFNDDVSIKPDVKVTSVTIPESE